MVMHGGKIEQIGTPMELYEGNFRKFDVGKRVQ